MNTTSSEKFELNSKFDSELSNYLEGVLPVIKLENVERAKRLLDYFNKNKLIFSGYKTESWQIDLKVILFNLISDIKIEDNEVNKTSEKFSKDRI